MGCADLVPGVSGGTVALILGVYERLIDALASLTRPAFRRAVRGGRIRAAAGSVDAPFLAALAGGIAVAVSSMSRLLSWLLATYPVGVYAVFFGLIAASAGLVATRVRRVGPGPVVAFAIGAVGAFTIVGLTPRETPDAAWFLILAGAVAVSALLLPGVSGAFLLVMLGKYEAVLVAVQRGDVAVLLPLAAGMALGLLFFSRALAWLLRRHHDATMGLLVGLLLGSLRKVWPWQLAQGHVTANAAPPGATEALAALLLAVAAAALVAAIGWLGAAREGA